MDHLLSALLWEHEFECWIALQGLFTFLHGNFGGRLRLLLLYFFLKGWWQELFVVLEELVPPFYFFLQLFLPVFRFCVFISQVHVELLLLVLEPPEKYVGELLRLDESGKSDVDLVEPKDLGLLSFKIGDPVIFQLLLHAHYHEQVLLSIILLYL